MQTFFDSSLMNRRATIQQRSTGKDTFGQQSMTWTDYLPVWAYIEPMTGRELIAAQAQQSEVTHQVVIRYRAGITAAMRLVYEGRIFDILSVVDTDTQHRRLVLQCAEGLTAG